MKAKLTIVMQKNGLATLRDSDGEAVYEHLHPLEARDIAFLVNELNISMDWDVLEAYLPEYPVMAEEAK